MNCEPLILDIHDAMLAAPRSRDRSPAILVEWTAALQAFVDADEAGLMTSAIRERALRAWAPLRDNPAFEPSRFALRLMDKVERALQ